MSILCVWQTQASMQCTLLKFATKHWYLLINQGIFISTVYEVDKRSYSPTDQDLEYFKSWWPVKLCQNEDKYICACSVVN